MLNEVFGPLIDSECDGREKRFFPNTGKRENEIVFEGELVTQFRDPTGSRVRINEWVVSGLDFVSPVFRYKIKAYKSDRMFQNMYTVYCYAFEVTPLPLTARSLKDMLLRVECTNRVIDPLLKDLNSNVSDATPLNRDRVREQLERRSQAISLDHPELKRFFLVQELQRLSTLYDAENRERLVSMPWDQIVSMYNTFQTDPTSLCCTSFHSYRWQIEDPDTGKMNPKPSYKDLVRVTEIDMSDLERLKVAVNSEQRAWITLYKFVKQQYYESKHIYVERYIIDMYLTDILEKGATSCAIDYLVSKNVFSIFEDRVYLYRAFLHESMIAEAFEILAKTALRKEDEWRDVCIFNNADIALLCDEQRKALKIALLNPVSVISGPGGCGKTRTLETFIKIVTQQDDICLVTAFQHKNVRHLKSIVPKNTKALFFTTHQLIACHAKCCHQSPWASSVKGTKDEVTNIEYSVCIFENVGTLVVDEAGLEYPEIIAKLLYSITLCSTKQLRIVFAGDVGQLASIHAGNLLHDLRFICREEFDSAIDLVHNHRAKSALLFNNANAIRQSNIDDFVIDNEIVIRVDIPLKSEHFEGAIIGLVERFKLDPLNSHFITTTNELKGRLNTWLEKYYQRLPVATPYIIYPTSKIIIRRPDASADVCNNEILNVTRIIDVIGRLTSSVSNTSAYLPRGSKRFLECLNLRGDFVKFELDSATKKCVYKAYATTNYSFIGDQCETIVYVVPHWNKHETNRTIYTGSTRASERLIYVGALETLERAILTPEPLRRTTLPLMTFFSLSNQNLTPKIKRKRQD
jgi:hypothetical protein